MSLEKVKVKKDKKVEKSNRMRKLVITEILIGLILILTCLVMNYMQQYLRLYYEEKNALGLISNSVLNNYLYQINITVLNQRIIWVISGFITIIGLILGAVSPFSGKGTPLFSEYVRLGLLISAVIIFYGIIALTGAIFIIT
ncbi:MAG: hypothetical protein ACTSPY_05955 [Candidatus Helarchaeota archaeon]